MKTPKEKATELFTKYFNVIEPLYEIGVDSDIIKESCLITVDEIINTITDLKLYDNSSLKYWLEVKKEIEKL